MKPWPILVLLPLSFKRHFTEPLLFTAAGKKDDAARVSVRQNPKWERSQGPFNSLEQASSYALNWNVCKCNTGQIPEARSPMFLEFVAGTHILRFCSSCQWSWCLKTFWLLDWTYWLLNSITIDPPLPLCIIKCLHFFSIVCLQTSLYMIHLILM